MKTLFLFTLALLLVGPRLWADAPASPSHGENAGPTLAQALVRWPPPKGVVLAVDAEKQALPPETVLPGVAPSVTETAGLYGLISRDFASVTVLAPATMTVFNEHPADPNIYLDMDKGELLTLLTASLTDAQWTAMTGKNGVALADLTAGVQPQIVAALFPGAHFRVQPADSKSRQEQIAEMDTAQLSGKPYVPNDLRDVTDDLPRARLRLGHKTEFMLPTLDNGYSGGPSDEESPHYRVFTDAEAFGFGVKSPHPQTTLYGLPIAAQAPNALKKSDIVDKDPDWNTAIPLAGLKTVGDLIDRIGSLTHREMYADRRWAERSLTITGTDRTAPASGLLQALALCLTGTYRRVGTAFVLTETQPGSGALHQRWADIWRQVSDRKSDMLGDVGKDLAARHSPRDLQGLGALTDMTDSQRVQALQPGGVFEGDVVYPTGTLFLPFSQLTPGQQEAVRHMIAQRDETQKSLPDIGIKPVSLSGKVMLTMTPAWQLVLPSLDGPVSLGDLISVTNLFQFPPVGAGNLPANFPADRIIGNGPPAPKPPALAAVMARVPRRAVLARPETIADLDSLVTSLRRAGMNQLWLVTFSEGRERPDLLAEALRAAHGTGIAVYAVVDVFGWGDKTPEALRDRNIFGEDSARSNAHMQQTEPDYAPSSEGIQGQLPPSNQIVATPTTPEVRKTLLSLVRSLATRPGLAGLVWRTAEPRGYDPLARADTGDDDRHLGYTDGLRLDYLRRTRMDPLDIAPNHSVEIVDGLLWQGQSEDFALAGQWATFRADNNRAFLRALYAAAKSANPALPILVREFHDGENGQGWYGTWDDPRRPPPTYHSTQDTPSPDQPTGRPPTQDIQAKAQSRVAQRLLAWMPDWPTLELASEIQDYVLGKRWDGFVLNLTQNTPSKAVSSGDPLAKLAHSLDAPK